MLSLVTRDGRRFLNQPGPTRPGSVHLPLFTKCVEGVFSEVRARLKVMASCSFGGEGSSRSGSARREGAVNMSAENEALVRRYVQEVYDQRKLEVVDEIFAPEFTLHDPDLPGGARGPEGIKRIVKTFVDAFPDLQVTLDEELSSGDKVVTRWTSRGTHEGELMGIAPTGKRIDVTAVGIWRVSEGKIAEAWLVFDALGMMQQLGVASSS
jgi:steroid delta-isomerase-like uncharacterized protein